MNNKVFNNNNGNLNYQIKILINSKNYKFSYKNNQIQNNMSKKYLKIKQLLKIKLIFIKKKFYN